MEKLAVILSKEVVDKILWMSEENKTEILGLGVAQTKEDPLTITDFYTMKQTAGRASVDVDDTGFALLISKLTEHVEPIQLRVWIHTHPFKGKPTPSGTDWSTFEILHGHCRWSVMVIISENQQAVGYLLHQDFPHQAVEIPVVIQDFWDADKIEAWKKELKENVQTKSYVVQTSSQPYYGGTYTLEDEYEWGQPVPKKDVVVPDDLGNRKGPEQKGVMVDDETGNGSNADTERVWHLCNFCEEQLGTRVCATCQTPACAECAEWNFFTCSCCGQQFCTDCAENYEKCPRCGEKVCLV